ncbi:hypothetical protein H0H93_016922 [Arthromyces matolae]|nr:hypothetical protein H0H93_016922 [Arthromyces matolae]
MPPQLIVPVSSILLPSTPLLRPRVPQLPQTASSTTSTASGARILQTITGLSSSLSPTPTSTSSTTATSTRRYFPDPSVTPTNSNDSQGPTSNVPKAILEYTLIVVLVVLFGGLLIQRVVYNRRRNVPFWNIRNNPSSTDPNAPISPQRFPRTTGLTEVPPYPYPQRTRAADTDVAGRRLTGNIDRSDHDGYIGDKDVLPAYDYAGGPPKYREVALELGPMSSSRTIPSVDSPGNINGSAAESTGDILPQNSHTFSDSPQGSRNDEPLAVPDAAHLH